MKTGCVTLRPSAKINLTLHVGSRRSDGFHDLQTLFQSIALADRLTITRRRGPLTLRVRPDVAPADRTNLVWRAAVLLWHAKGKTGEPRGVAIDLDKSIPVAAGLGGGSADAAAALAGLNAVWGRPVPQKALIEVAAQLGSDVPFFLYGGTALGLGRGEDLYPAADIRRLGLVIVTPDFGISTPDAYRWLDEDRASRSATSVARPDATACLDVGWPGGPFPLVNDLQGPVARRHPRLADAIAALDAAGSLASAMCGSGSSVFGVFPEAAVSRAARRLQRPEWRVVPTHTLSRREARRRIGLC